MSKNPPPPQQPSSPPAPRTRSSSWRPAANGPAPITGEDAARRAASRQALILSALAARGAATPPPKPRPAKAPSVADAERGAVPAGSGAAIESINPPRPKESSELAALAAAAAALMPPPAPPPSPPPPPPPPETPSAAPPRSPGSHLSLGYDLGEVIRKEARKVRASDLAARHNEVQVMGMTAILRLIEQVVDETLHRQGRDLDGTERRRLIEEAEEEFNERLKALKLEKADVEARARALQDQLARAQSLLEEERSRVVSAEQFTVSDAGIVELEKRLSRILDRCLLKGGASAELEAEMRGVVSKLLDDEREKIRQRAVEAQSDNIALLEKKIRRLSSTLEDTEKARKKAERRAEILESQGVSFGAHNILEAGLDDEDPDREMKLALLKEIVESNKDVREFLVNHDLLPQKPAKPAPAAKAESAPEKAAPSEADTSEIAGAGEVEAAPRPASELETGDIPSDADTAAASAPLAAESPGGQSAGGVRRLDAGAARTRSPPPLERRRGKRDRRKEPLELVDSAKALLAATQGTADLDPDDLPWEPDKPAGPAAEVPGEEKTPSETREPNAGESHG